MAAVWLSGSRLLDAPWQNGDEFMFIVRNADVTGRDDPAPWLIRIAKIFTQTHEDLYQPVPIAFYATLWTMFGNSPIHFRTADLLLHAGNALLAWWVLTTLLRRIRSNLSLSNVCPTGSDASSYLLTWGLAALWALHPALINAYAGDLGTPHMLTAALCMLSLQTYLRINQQKGVGRYGFFALSLLLLALANAAKPTPGWLFLLAALMLTDRALRKPIHFAHLAGAAALSLVFSFLAIKAGQESKLLEEASRGLFGDPLSRSLLAVTYYVRNLVAPFWLSAWYPPDPDTGWGHPRVWLGGAILIASGIALAVTVQQKRFAALVIGLAWFWGLLGPVLGLVGAREAIAFDRYLYQPLLAVLLMIGGWITQASETIPVSRNSRRLPQFVGICAALLAAGCMLWNILPDSPDDSPVAVSRSPIRKAQRAVRMNPGDPRVLEMLAAQYDFSRDHALHPIDAPPPPPPSVEPAEHQWRFFNELFVQALLAAAECPDMERYFATVEDRGQFHRRMAKYFATAGRPDQTLVQARKSYALEPEAYGSWLWLARALTSLGRYDEARTAYLNAEQRAPENPATRAVLFTESGLLHLRNLDDPDEALPRLRAALATGRATSIAALNLAKAEIRAGSGIDGANLVMQVLQAEPHNLEAALVLGEYHLRSHHWEEAGRLYALLLEQFPTNFEALLGMQEWAARTGNWQPLLEAWENAAHKALEARPYRAFLVWALACANDRYARERAEEILATDPGNDVAQMALLLMLVRGAELESAYRLIRERNREQPIRGSRILERCRSTLRVLRERGELPPAAVLIEAILWGETGSAERALELLDEFRKREVENSLEPLLERIRGELSTTPAR